MGSIEGNGWKDFNEEEFLNIDQEWKEFNENLPLDTDADLEAINARAEYDEVSKNIIDKMRQRSLPNRVIDGNPDVEENLMRNYASDYVAANGPVIFEETEAITKEQEVQLAINCILDYYRERELQALIINEISLCSFLLQKSKGHQLMIDLVMHEKKRIQAELLIHHKRVHEDAWYVFFDQEIKSPGLDTSSRDDQKYIMSAIEGLLDFENNDKKRIQLLEAAKKIMGFDDLQEDLSEVIQVTGDLIEMHIIVADPIHTDRDKIHRNEQLWEYGRTNGFETKILAKIIELFENEY